MNTSIKLVRTNNFDNDVILIDGQGRSGKNLIALVLSTMSKVEKMNLTSHLDYIARYYNLGKMSADAAEVALKLFIDE